jgi:hypothetical protein
VLGVAPTRYGPQPGRRRDHQPAAPTPGGKRSRQQAGRPRDAADASGTHRPGRPDPPRRRRRRHRTTRVVPTPGTPPACNPHATPAPRPGGSASCARSAPQGSPCLSTWSAATAEAQPRLVCPYRRPPTRSWTHRGGYDTQDPTNGPPRCRVPHPLGPLVGACGGVETCGLACHDEWQDQLREGEEVVAAIRDPR